jgi:predicted nucleic acid-binding protein
MDPTEVPAVVTDTNLFVGAGFHPNSASARILRLVREGALRLVWSDATRRETLRIVRKIPPLAGMDLSGLFREEDRFDGPLYPERFGEVPDPDDRKFLALAAATGATLLTSDDHLLAVRDGSPVPILTPGEFLRRLGGDNA